MIAWVIGLILAVVMFFVSIGLVLYAGGTEKEDSWWGFTSYFLVVPIFMSIFVSIGVIGQYTRSEYVCYDIYEIKEIDVESKTVSFTVLEEGIVVTYKKSYDEIIQSDSSKLEIVKEYGVYFSKDTLYYCVKEE